METLISGVEYHTYNVSLGSNLLHELTKPCMSSPLLVDIEAIYVHLQLLKTIHNLECFGGGCNRLGFTRNAKGNKIYKEIKGN
jgi:hypothetical protein